MVKGSCTPEEFRVSLEKKKSDEKVLAIRSYHTFYSVTIGFALPSTNRGK